MFILFAGSEASIQTRPLKSSSAEPSEPTTPDQRRVSPPEGFRTDHVIQIEPDSPPTSPKTLYMTKEEDSPLQKPLTPTPSVHTPSRVHTPEVYPPTPKLPPPAPKIHPPTPKIPPAPTTIAPTPKISPPTPSTAEREQILSASSLEAQYKSMTETPKPTSSPVPPKAETVPSTSDRESVTPRLPSSPTPRPTTPMKPPVIPSSSKTPTKPSLSSTSSEHLRSPSPRSARVSPTASPSPSVKTDKGKSKVTGKVVSGWL